MSFKFNFGNCDGPSVDNERDKDSKDKIVLEKSLQLLPCVFHKPDLFLKENYLLQPLTAKLDNHVLRYFHSDSVKIQDSKLNEFLDTSDLESGHYEGGLKIWECTWDLLDYLTHNKQMMQNKHVLDLGCGAGLLGIYTFLNGSKSICLQDYNSDVIQNLTVPTVCRNICKSFDSSHKHIEEMDQFTFISGDWMSILIRLKENKHGKFDLILSSETIYNTDYYFKICSFLQEHMKVNGVALFAAKTHYFGVGGGTHEFIHYILQYDNLEVNVVSTNEKGVSREILKIEKVS